MPNAKSDPIRELPPTYQQVHYMSINERGMLIWLNLMSLIPLAISGLLVFGTLMIYQDLGSPLTIDGLPDSVPPLIGLGLALIVLPLHEWIHGLAIAHFGHQPRYGIKLFVLFATSDGALFRRDEFIKIALAPLLAISLVGGMIMLFLPFGLAYWVGLAVVLNAAGAIGDLWMTSVVLRFGPSTLVRDEEDSMRVFAPVTVKVP
jgi:hypothetical protein